MTLYGNLDPTLYTTSANGKSATTSSNSGGSTSLWGITGTEDLGGGLKVSFDLKSELNLLTGHTGSASTGVNAAAGSTTLSPNPVGTTTATITATTAATNYTSNVFNRGAWVGLSGGFGDVKVGRQNDVWWEQTARFGTLPVNSFGWAGMGATVSGWGANTFNGLDLTTANPYAAPVSTTTTKPTQNPIAQGSGEAFVSGLSYEAPSMNGFTAKVQTGSKTSMTSSKGAWNGGGYSLAYANGPFKAAYAMNYRNDGQGATGMTQKMTAGSYETGPYKFTVAQNKTGFAGDLAGVGHAMTILSYGASMKNGAWEYAISYSTLKDNDDSAYKTTQTGLVARYSLSKRTTAYVGYGTGKNEGANNKMGLVYGGASVADGAQSITAIIGGIRHTF